METFIIFWFGFIVGLSVIVLLYRKRIDTLESEIDSQIFQTPEEIKAQYEHFLLADNVKAKGLFHTIETFPEYLERVGAIKPKFELSEELKAKYGSFGDIPRPTRHKSEKDILDKFDIDIAKTCEENEAKLNHALDEYFKLLTEINNAAQDKRRFEPFSDRRFPLDKNGNGGC